MYNVNEKYNEYLTSFNLFLQTKFNEFHHKFPNVLADAMQYAVEGGGKRVRPVLALATADMLGVDKSKVLNFALAIELIHSYSLVHDDLPAMDNDDYRRGKLSTHKKFGEAIGILAGDGLLNYAFEVCLQDEDFNKDQAKALKIIGEYAGPSGMIAGQVLDLQNEKNPAWTEEVLYSIYENKTAKLIMAPVLVASALAGGKHFEQLKEFAYNLGILFQITDDLMDEEGDLQSIGKTPHKDKEADKLTSVKVFGVEGARERGKVHYEKCKQILNEIPNSEFLKGFTDKMYFRKS